MLFSNFFYIIAAILPAIIILIYVFKQDNFPEPIDVVIKTFIFGAGITIALDLSCGRSKFGQQEIVKKDIRYPNFQQILFFH